MNKIIKILLIVILTIIAIGLSFFLYAFIQKDYDFNFSAFFSHESNTLIDNKIFDSINNISIKSDVADIYIKNNVDNNYRVEIYSDNEKNHSIDVIDNNLNIAFDSGSNIFFAKSSRIVVYIPTTFNNNITINNTTGDIKVESFEFANINVESTTGDTNIDSVNSLNYKNSTGDLDINVINDLIVDSKTGDIDVNNINKKLNIKTKTGDIKIDTINLNEDSYIDSNVGDININNANNIYIETESRVGDAKVNNRDRFSQITLHIKTDVGDIRVN